MEPTVIAANVVDHPGLGWGLFTAVFLSGLRHGFDVDHLVAISDISTSQTTRRRSIILSTIYAVGHAVVLMVLGIVAVIAGDRVPAVVESVMGQIIGATLVALGIYVLWSLARYGRNVRLRSRWMLLLSGLRRTLRWLRSTDHQTIEIEHSHGHGHVGTHTHDHAAGRTPEDRERRVSVLERHEHAHRHAAPLPSDPFAEYGPFTAFGVGMIHGVGAETPTQVLLFATAAGLAGSIPAVLLVTAFVGGLFIANTIVAVGAAWGFSGGRRFPLIYAGLAGVTAAISIYVGSLYLLDRAYLLPDLLGG